MDSRLTPPLLIRPTRAATDVPPGDPQLGLRLALDLGAWLLAHGGTAGEVARAIQDVLACAGLSDVSVAVDYDHLLVSVAGPDGEQVMRSRVITGRGVNFGRLTNGLHLLQDVVDGRIGLQEASARLSDVKTRPEPYPRLWMDLGAGLTGAMTAVVFGGHALSTGVAFVVTALLSRGTFRLGQRGWFAFHLQMVAGGGGVLAALFVHRLSPDIGPGMVVLAVMFVMLAGVTITAAVHDAITGWYAAAGSRLLEALTSTAGLMLGVSVGLMLLRALGSPLTLDQNLPLKPHPEPLLLLACGLASVGFTLLTQSPLRTAGPVAALSALACAAYHWGLAQGGGVVWASALAALLVGGLSVPLTQWLRCAAPTLTVCALLPLLPGWMLYRGLLDASQNVTLIAQAMSVALALAVGTITGQQLGLLGFRFTTRLESRFAPFFARPREDSLRDRAGNPGTEAGPDPDGRG